MLPIWYHSDIYGETKGEICRQNFTFKRSINYSYLDAYNQNSLVAFEIQKKETSWLQLRIFRCLPALTSELQHPEKGESRSKSFLESTSLWVQRGWTLQKPRRDEQTCIKVLHVNKNLAKYPILRSKFYKKQTNKECPLSHKNLWSLLVKYHLVQIWFNVHLELLPRVSTFSLTNSYITSLP